jgi:flagellar protein FliO/FliZ
MDLLAIARALFGLVLTLGLVGLAAYAARRWGPTGMFQTKPASQRRMAVVETLSLGPTVRLLLVKVDAEERLVIVGEGRVLPAPAKGPARA